MKFKHKWEFETEDILSKSLESGNKKLHNLIVDIALKNLITKLKEIPVVTIHAKDSDVIYDIMIDRLDIIETLEQNLIIMEEHEDYERCQKIFEALKYLKSKL